MMKKSMISVLAISMMACMAFGIPNMVPARAAADGPKYDLKDIISYGTYNRVELKWEVVAKSGSQVTLFLKDVLRDGTENPDGDMLLKQFNQKDVGSGSAGQNDWETSLLKTFLNGEFYNAAFNETQKRAIVEVSGSYPGYQSADSTRQGEPVANPPAGTAASKSKVFLPTYGDISAWYTSLEDRSLGDTDIWWWTRSPVYVVPGSVSDQNGGERQLVWYAHEGGENRAPVTYFLAIRPVIVIDTAKLQEPAATYTVSGTVNAGAKVTLYRGETKVAEATADENGKYSLSPVEAGTYTLEVSLEGFTAQRVEVTVSDANVVKDVTLTAVEPDDPDIPDNPDNPDKPDNPENPGKPDDPDDKDNRKGLSAGAIAGIVAACVAVAAGCGIGLFFLLRKKSGK